MKLTKMHGLGNDFILFADPQGANKDYTDLAIRLCDRRTGIGADGLVIVVPSDTCDVRMRIINSDGSEAEMCGNGIQGQDRDPFQGAAGRKRAPRSH